LKHLPKITIVTPSYNLGSYIEATIKSVLNQQYPNLEYIIVDGGSTDNTLSIFSKYENQLTKLIIEPDNGLYDAINKGFSHSTGEIMGWINADDVLHHKSLFTIADLFSRNKQISWIQGHPTVIDKDGKFVMTRNANNSPWPFLTRSFNRNSFIQQESTYWRSSLYQKAGGYVSQNYGLAGDFELWMRFFRFEKLHNINNILSSFRVRNHQLSKNENLYMSEVEDIISKELKLISKIRKYKNGTIFKICSLLEKVSKALHNRIENTSV
jgi:glycosyltransferase involved in cell wall biosynthesis